MHSNSPTGKNRATIRLRGRGKGLGQSGRIDPNARIDRINLSARTDLTVATDLKNKSGRIGPNAPSGLTSRIISQNAVIGRRKQIGKIGRSAPSGPIIHKTGRNAATTTLQKKTKANPNKTRGITTTGKTGNAGKRRKTKAAVVAATNHPKALRSTTGIFGIL